MHGSYFAQNFYPTGPFFSIDFAENGAFRVIDSVFVDNNYSFFSVDIINSHNGLNILVDHSTFERNGGYFLQLRLHPLQDTQNVMIDISNSNFSNNTYYFAYDVTWDQFEDECGNQIYIHYNITRNIFSNNSARSFFHHFEYNNVPRGIHSEFLFSENLLELNCGTFLTISADFYHLDITL